MFTLTTLPLLNAILNSISALLLGSGYLAIRRRRVGTHRACMLAACLSSALFLTSYLVYHYHVGSKHFPGQGTIRVVYLAILGSHTLLAAAIVPLVLLTLSRALRAQWSRHRRLARWTLPLWFYVSVTGVIIYVMLYQLYDGA